MNTPVLIPSVIRKQLEKCQKQVVTRFPPEPSGYLHIGHAKAIYYNYIIAKQYNGIFLLRMDDTNPTKESSEYENAIVEDISTILKISDYKLSYTSSYFEQILSYAEQLIASGEAYVDSTPAEVMKKERYDGVLSTYRGRTIDENLSLWKEIKQGSITDACLRIKLDPVNKNKCVRDPVIYRYLNSAHHRTGEQYKVYPTYDFACPVVDILEGVTHVYRNLEFFDRDLQYTMILNKLQLQLPVLGYYCKLQFIGIEIGKRYMKKLVADGLVAGWDDPRLYTLRGLMKRGLHLDGLLQFLSSMLFTSNGGEAIDVSLLWNLNRKVIDKLSGRYVVLQEDVVELEVALQVEEKQKELQLFHRNPQLGTKLVYYTPKVFVNRSDLVNGEETTLLNYGDAVKTAKIKLMWLPACNESPEKRVVKVVITKITDYQVVTSKYIGEPALAFVTVGSFVQLLKMGYYRCDSNDGTTITLIEI